MSGMFEIKAKIISKTFYTGKIFALEIYAPEIARTSQPGHFVMLRPANWTSEPALNRPMSVARVHPESGLIEVQILIAGKGSLLISELKSDDYIFVVGPLGTTFTKPQADDRVAIIGGGIGIAPIIFFKEYWGDQIKSLYCAYGAASQSDLIPEQFTGTDFHLATDDGTFGHSGFVTDLLSHQLEQQNIDKVYACGPNSMLKTIQQISQKFKVLTEISIETVMACGYGLCLGCVVESAQIPGTYRLACKDGPVFNADEINLK